MDDHFNLLDGLLARVHGPLAFRFLLQPLMACVLAFRDGRRDAREGKPPFLWTAVRDASRRRVLLRGAWMSIGSVMVVAALVDVLFQWMVFGGPRPGAGMMAAVALAALPYSLVRGVVNRLSSRH